MSGIFGIFRQPGEHVTPELEFIADVLGYRGPVGIRNEISTAIGFGHCMLWTTAESLHEVDKHWPDKTPDARHVSMTWMQWLKWVFSIDIET